MKKSKIVIPALALIAFSMAASITGSVAWFTANRQATITAGSYAVVKTTANLEATVTAGAGTRLASGTTDTIEVKDASGNANLLTDGSFDHLTGNIYTPNSTATAVESSKTTNVSSLDSSKLERATLANGAKIYTAVTFNIEFSVSFYSTPGDIGLFLNADVSKFDLDTEENPAPALATAKGFRMGFYSTAHSSDGQTTSAGVPAGAKVFADMQADDNCKYVGATAAANGFFTTDNTDPEHPVTTENYASYTTDLMDVDYDDDTDLTGLTLAQATARPDYLGKFSFGTDKTCSLTYAVVCWFEGTDPQITNAATVFQAVSAVLEFDAVALPAAAQQANP